MFTYYRYAELEQQKQKIPPLLDTGCALKSETTTKCVQKLVTGSGWMTYSDRSGYLLCPALGHTVTPLSYVTIVTLIICAS